MTPQYVKERGNTCILLSCQLQGPHILAAGAAAARGSTAIMCACILLCLAVARAYRVPFLFFCFNRHFYPPAQLVRDFRPPGQTVVTDVFPSPLLITAVLASIFIHHAWGSAFPLFSFSIASNFRQLTLSRIRLDDL